MRSGDISFLFAGMQRAGAAAHPAADLVSPLEIVHHRGHRADRGSHDRLATKAITSSGPFEDVERLGRAGRIGLIRLARLSEAVGETGIDMVGLYQNRAELRAPPFVAAG